MRCARFTGRTGAWWQLARRRYCSREGEFHGEVCGSLDAGLQWGSVADWVAAIGTSLALLLTLAVVLGDRRAHRRQLADRVGVWLRLIATGSKSAPMDAEIVLHNGSSLPVPVAWVYVATDETWRTRAISSDIPIGERVCCRWALDADVDLGKLRVLVEFTDGNGRTWTRDARRGTYVSASARRWRLGARPMQALN